MKQSTFLLYGANGYTGELIARLAVKQGIQPILAGRHRERVAALASELGLEYRVFGLGDPAEVDTALADMPVVLHCAGPFSHTARPMVDACLHMKTHYLDITGEIVVFETLARREAEARAAGVMLLPGAGFDVVPSDCLAAHLKSRLPSAENLVLAFRSSGSLSHGTATTMVESIHLGGVVRRNGKLTRVPAGWKTRQVDFGRGPRPAIMLPWGDVASAFYSTGIPNIEVYSALPPVVQQSLKASHYLRGLLGTGPAQRLLKRVVDAQPSGPDENARATGSSHFWGEVSSAAGQKAGARLHTPEGYALTAMTALSSACKALAGNAPAGFKTPSLAYGADFILEFAGVTREDLA